LPAYDSKSWAGRRGIDALLNVRYSTFQPLVGLSYSTPVKIDAQNMSRLLSDDALRFRCCIHYPGASNGGLEDRPDHAVFGEFRHKLWFDRAFMQKSVRLDMNRLEAPMRPMARLSARGAAAVRPAPVF